MSNAYRVVSRGWLYQPPASPFAAELQMLRKMKQSCYLLQQQISRSLPPFPAPPQYMVPAPPPFPMFLPTKKG